jgi:3-oxoacyl-[acyl-carrier-protein] synthase II
MLLSRPETRVGYVNAHGTSTPVGDSAETRVIKLALGEEKAYRTPGLLDEGRHGALPRRGGAFEASFTILALERGVLPPTINQEVPDPECDLDYIPNESREQQVEIGVSNSFGFGGHNACVVFHAGTADRVRRATGSPSCGRAVSDTDIRATAA